MKKYRIPEALRNPGKRIFESQEEYNQWRYRYTEAATILVDKQIESAQAWVYFSAVVFGGVSVVALGVGGVLAYVFESPLPFLIPTAAIMYTCVATAGRYKLYKDKKKLREAAILAKAEELNKRYPLEVSCEAILNCEAILDQIKRCGY